jgi:hypothetical protein
MLPDYTQISESQSRITHGEDTEEGGAHDRVALCVTS